MQLGNKANNTSFNIAVVLSSRTCDADGSLAPASGQWWMDGPSSSVKFSAGAYRVSYTEPFTLSLFLSVHYDLIYNKKRITVNEISRNLIRNCRIDATN